MHDGFLSWNSEKNVCVRLGAIVAWAKKSAKIIYNKAHIIKVNIGELYRFY